MVLKLYAMRDTNAGRGVVALLLEEKQIPFDLIVVDLK
jgi:glutathione S-transferase